MEKDILVKVTAHNCPGLLQRVCALFSRRFFNIQSIVAAQKSEPGVSQIFIVVRGDNRIARQVEKQLDKLYDVVSVEILDADKVILREHMMIKVKKNEESGAQFDRDCQRFPCKRFAGRDRMQWRWSCQAMYGS